MRAFALFATILALSSCRSKAAPSTEGSASAGSSIAGPAVAGSAAAGSADAGSAATIDPRLAALPAEERHTCGIYARCKVEGLRDDDPQAPAKQPAFEDACLAVWVTLSAADKKQIASCADAVGQCLGPPPCFDSMKL